MGFRMSIIYNGKDYSGDHKLYGYRDLNTLTSFKVLVPEIVRQWGVPSNFTEEDIYSVYFCHAGVTEDLVLDEIIFSVFAKKYCDDIKKAFGDDGDYIIAYMEELLNFPGNKIVNWG